jgi:2-keto-3-deoxy-L-rhamnonate aldolase RhmA
MEHGAFDLSRIRETILAARASGIAPIVRVSEPQYHLITRVLDAGAEGIIVPRVESSRQCEDLVKFSRYPPHGERGISTFAGHNSFRAIPDVPAFLESRNRDVLWWPRSKPVPVWRTARRSSRSPASTPAWSERATSP